MLYNLNVGLVFFKISSYRLEHHVLGILCNTTPKHHKITRDFLFMKKFIRFF